ncbi:MULTISPECIES: hypothetical protein [Nocardia]|uniref:hypothetical protein n=1 Tax=Nocardia TaxID=1817 RepID=UPI002458E4B7|nr:MULTISPECIES: hypothetical protein [Nocardia]
MGEFSAVERTLAGLLAVHRGVSPEDVEAVVEGQLHRREPSAAVDCDINFPRYGMDGSKQW